jgi:hypothetical protein
MKNVPAAAARRGEPFNRISTDWLSCLRQVKERSGHEISVRTRRWLRGAGRMQGDVNVGFSHLPVC